MILVTGGAGYIGSHVVKALGQAGYDVVVYDNLSTGHEWAVLYGKLIRGDVRDQEALDKVFKQHSIDAVMHFAAHIVVPESVRQPLKYYLNNVTGSLSLLEAMKRNGLRKFIFSSSAAVYGIPDKIPITEENRLDPINPYGQTKAVVEKVLADMAYAQDLDYVALRYFNVAGADPQARIGEGKEDATHIITMCVRTAAGLRPCLEIFGTDYPTPEGTNIRDYIHVEDLADAHILAMEKLQPGQSIFCNLGTGRGFSVKEIIAAVEKVAGRKMPVEYGPRRAGDAIALYADPSLAKKLLGWEAKHKDPETIIRSAWNWHSKNPRGYRK